MTFKQLEQAIQQLREWEREVIEIQGHNYDPHGHDTARLAEIERLKEQEIP